MRLCRFLITLALAVTVAGCSSVFKQEFADGSPKVIPAEVDLKPAKESFAFEAELGRVVVVESNTWVELSDADASGTKMALRAGDNFYAEAKLGPGITWTYVATTKGTYDIWVRVKPNAAGDSLFFEWAGESQAQHWPEDTLDNWVWTQLRSVKVLAGEEYEFSLWAREDRIDVDLAVIQSAGAAEPALPVAQ